MHFSESNWWPDDLESQGRWHLFSIPVEGIPGCIFDANLVIPAQIYDELSCGQSEVYRGLDRRADAGYYNTPQLTRGKM